jgi:malonate transporter MadM subunit
MIETLEKILLSQGLLAAFVIVGVIMLVSDAVSRTLTRGRIHPSAIAIVIGLCLAYLGGRASGGEKGLADISYFSGVGLLGGAMLRDFAIVATAFEVDIREAGRAGLVGAASILIGVLAPFVLGAGVAHAFGYSDAVSMTTIGAGAVTYIVGPVTGAALGASSDVMALSIATGVLKAVLVMVATPALAPLIGLNNPRSAMIFGGVMGTTSGVTAGLAATDPKLVPYGALTSTFYTGVGCLLGPSALFLAVRAVTGG